MGIIKATFSAIGGGLADQWLEVIQADQMGEDVLFTAGVKVRPNDKRNQNYKGTDQVVSNGSIIHVEQNQFMLLVDGGKVVDYTAEPGYYKVENSISPSLFSGGFGDALKETFNRIRFAGVTPYMQKVYFINLQEIRNIPFGTVNPVNYFDEFYKAELFLRAHGYFSVRVVEPLKFYAEAVGRSATRLDVQAFNRQYVSEFLTALQSSINQMSADGIRISHVPSKSQELSKYMATVLDEEWKSRRGMEVESVGVASVSYDEESRKLLSLRNQGAMLSDPAVREGYVQGAAARGIEAAGSNKAGSMQGFMGVGMGMQGAGAFMSSASEANQAQMKREAQAEAEAKVAAKKDAEAKEAQKAAEAKPVAAPAGGWACECGKKENAGAFCPQCGKKKPAVKSDWDCACGKTNNTGNFCSQCGKKKPAAACGECGHELGAGQRFCPNCGAKQTDH